MYIEFSAIIVCRFMYLAFRSHRFVVGFGYGFDANDVAMTSVVALMTSMFIELAFEAIVDGFALIIEYKHGIDLNKFWDMWRVNPTAFWGLFIMDGFVAALAATWAFKLIPNAAFCTSPTDPCSCNGGGFEIYDKFCNPESTKDGNETSNSTTTIVDDARQEFQSVFDTLVNENTSATLVGVVAILTVITIFALAYMYRQSLEATARADKLAKLERKRGTSFARYSLYNALSINLNRFLHTITYLCYKQPRERLAFRKRTSTCLTSSRKRPEPSTTRSSLASSTTTTSSLTRERMRSSARARSVSSERRCFTAR